MSQLRVDEVDAAYTKVKVYNLEPRSEWIKWPFLINEWATHVKSKGRNYTPVVLSSRRIIGDGNGIHLWALRMREISMGSGSQSDINEWENSFKLDSLNWHFGHRHKRNFAMTEDGEEAKKKVSVSSVYTHKRNVLNRTSLLAEKVNNSGWRQGTRDDVLNTANNSFL